ncbi:MAG: DUF3592 domain-containing protein [Lentisphaeria bacterium]|nr:DUF3592 domain-containing protein [Lentisphaeria bacterium]
MGSDNIGSWQQDQYHRLDTLRQENKVLCYVNPKDPSEAVIIRDVRIGMILFLLIFGLVFGLVGYGIIWAGFYSLRNSKKESKLRELHPDSPWKNKTEWSGDFITSSNKASLIGIFVFAVIWNAISSPVLFMVPAEIKKGNNAAWIGLLFPLIGLLMIIMTIHQFLKLRRFGESKLYIDGHTAVLGGTLNATIETSCYVDQREGFDISLDCTKTTTSGSGDNRRTHTTIIWQAAQTIHQFDSRGNVQTIPFEMKIPYDIPDSDTANHSWTLTIKADVPGPDYSARFNIPVFKTDASDPINTTSNETIDPEKISLEKIAQDERVIIQQSAEKLQIKFPLLRNISTVIFLFIFTAIWIGITFFLYTKAAWLFFGIWFLIDLILVYAMIKMIFSTTYISVNSQGISLKNCLFGIGKLKHISPSEIQEIKKEQSMTSGSKVYYRIVIKCLNDKNLTAGSNIGSKELTDSLIALMKHYMNP